MGPPLNIWPSDHRSAENDSDRASDRSYFGREHLIVRVVRDIHVIHKLTIALVLLQIILNLNIVLAGPVLLNAHNLQGPITVARNIRHLPCISRRTRQEGVCMFAIDCIKANGTHLGTCIDRFYFGSCCQIPDKTVLPQIIGNNIDDETIDSNFVHPQTDKVHNVMPESIFPTRKPTTTTTEKVKTTITSMIGIEQKYTTDMESKTDAAMTGIDNKIEDDSQVTTALVNKVTTKIPEEMSKITTVSSTTETPAKLSTFQTVSDEYNKFTTEKNTIPFEEVTDVYSKETSMETTHGESTTTTRKPMATTRIPIRTTTIKSNHKPRPTLKPLNITRPQIHSPTKPLNITSRPKPTKPVSSFNITRPIPPYKLPPKRPTPTKKPIPLPPRLNITILPQSTSVKPVSTTRPSLTTITYINTTTTNEDRPTSTSTTSPSPTTIKTTEKLSTVSLTEPTTTTTTTTSTIKTSTATTSASTVEPLESSSKSTSPSSASSSSTSSLSTSSSTVEVTTRPGTSTPSLTTEKEVKEPATETEQPTTVSKVLSTEKVTTDFPPGLVTWSNTVDATTKSPEVITTSSLPDIWSPITPPEGWVLISTIPPKTDSSSTTHLSTSSSSPTTTIEPLSSSEMPINNGVISSTQLSSSTTVKETSSSTISTTSSSTSTTSSTTTTPISSSTSIPITGSTLPDFTSTVLPASEIPSSTTISSPSSQAPTTVPTTLSSSVTEAVTQKSTTTFNDVEKVPASASTTSTTEKVSTTTMAVTDTKVSVTESSVPEFTVNVTLSPTVPTSTSSVGLTTFTSILSDNTTDTASVTGNYSDTTTVSNVTSSPVDSTVAVDNTTVSAANATSTSNETTTAPTASTAEAFNASNYKEVCGRRLWPEARIVGGAKSGFGMWPWQISLRQWRTSTYLHKCGAALLNENWAITAAHCVEHVPPSELLVRLGEHDLANEDEPYGFAERRVQIVASHPHFDPATFEYDLALLRFYEPVRFQPNIVPVCVPDDDENFVGRTAYVTGWGRLYDEGPLPSVLQEVEVPVINNTACEAMYRAAGYNEHIPNIFICAGRKKGGSDSCEGDSGGPMVLQRERDKRFVLGGIISWGIGCAEPNQPGVYTRISEFRDWINQILQF